MLIIIGDRAMMLYTLVIPLKSRTLLASSAVQQPMNHLANCAVSKDIFEIKVGFKL
jgi:hypothetical protein